MGAEEKQARKYHVDQEQVSSKTLAMSGPKTLTWSGKLRASYEKTLEPCSYWASVSGFFIIKPVGMGHRANQR